MSEAGGEQRLFAMQHGPFIPWALAELIYEAYSSLYGPGQSIERMHERGGFSWREVEIIFSDLARRHPKKLEQMRQRHGFPYISTTRGRQ
jgi:hypothetical protein